MFHFIQKFSQASSKVGLFSKYLSTTCQAWSGWAMAVKERTKKSCPHIFGGEDGGKIQKSKIFNMSSGKCCGEL